MGALVTGAGRRIGRTLALEAAVSEVFARHTQAHWTERFDAADCCVTPILRMDEAMHHPLFTAADRR